MRTPLILALLIASVLPASAQVRAAEPPAAVRSLPGVASAPAKVEPFPVSIEAEKFLASLGWKVESDGGLVRAEGAEKGRIAPIVIIRGGLRWLTGEIVYASTPFPLEKDKMGAFLEGLANFTAVAAMDPAMAGVALAGGGSPRPTTGSRSSTRTDRRPTTA